MAASENMSLFKSQARSVSHVRLPKLSRMTKIEAAMEQVLSSSHHGSAERADLSSRLELEN